MKKIISYILTGVVGMSAACALWSCSAENPFESDGTGTIQLRTVVNSITTRADDQNDQSSLEEKCVVYISGTKGLIYKKQGLGNVDPQITLKAGSYVAEAWTGDSVSASFDKKFYRGYQPFELKKGDTQNVVVNCRIANVVASINTSTINPVLMKDDYVITIKNSAGECVFTKDNAIDGKAYFMMPNDDTTLEYTIAGTRKDGGSFTKSGKIEKVERAHHYILNFEYNPETPDDPTTGAVFIKINIKDEVISNDNVTVFSRPTATGVDFNIDKQLVFINDDDIPEVVSVQICGDGLDDIELSLGCCTWKVLLNLNTTNDQFFPDKRPLNFGNLNPDDQRISICKEKGIEYLPPNLDEKTKIETAHLNFSKEVFTRLLRNPEEHVFSIRITDRNKQETVATLRVARTENAIILDDPIEVEQVDPKDWRNIKAHSVNLTYTLADNIEGTPGIEYSKADEDNWTFVPVSSQANAPRYAMTRGSNKYALKITGLEAGTTYKYRACCGDFHGDDIMTFTTESKFIIPNASLEEWSNFVENEKILLPGAGGQRTFWDSGNHGSATMSVTLTQFDESMKHTGEKSARLRSQFVGLGGFAGKFAAGNLFAGSYLETQGTDGRLEFGRPYNGSHPVALRVWVNYRPGVADKNGSKNGHMAQGEVDEGQIYVALSTEPVEVRTKASNRKLFNKDENVVLAYGEHTFYKENYGADGELKELIIPIDYKDNAVKEMPTHLIIVCSASKYGDFFDGGEGSTMYVDDFELIYE
ncbi:MAG: PCMD domain-containing protein [Muribaculaceae bacterium]|nr:PCMD domain-containing protein [Muribaculaceae bacterium]